MTNDENLKGHGSDSTGSACNAGDPVRSLITASGRLPGEGNCNLLQYSCLENSMNRGAWWAVVHGIAKSQTHLSYSHLCNNGRESIVIKSAKLVDLVC